MNNRALNRARPRDYLPALAYSAPATPYIYATDPPPSGGRQKGHSDREANGFASERRTTGESDYSRTPGPNSAGSCNTSGVTVHKTLQSGACHTLGLWLR